MKQSDPFVVYGENMILWLQPEPGNYDFTLSVLGGGRQTANGKIKLRAEHLAELSEHLSELAQRVAEQKERGAA